MRCLGLRYAFTQFHPGFDWALAKSGLESWPHAGQVWATPWFLDLAWISESAEQVMALGLGEAFSIPGQVLVGPRGVGYDSVLL